MGLSDLIWFDDTSAYQEGCCLRHVCMYVQYVSMALTSGTKVGTYMHRLGPTAADPAPLIVAICTSPHSRPMALSLLAEP